MDRLTKDLKTPHDDTTYSDIVVNAIDRENIALTKLKHYEDLEEELGCPLDVVFKAIEDGIIIIGDLKENGDMTLWLDKKPLIALIGEKHDFEEPRLIKYDDWCFSCESGSYSGCVALKDYKKTWWLKKMEVNRR